MHKTAMLAFRETKQALGASKNYLPIPPVYKPLFMSISQLTKKAARRPPCSKEWNVIHAGLVPHRRLEFVFAGFNGIHTASIA